MVIQAFRSAQISVLADSILTRNPMLHIASAVKLFKPAFWELLAKYCAYLLIMGKL